MGNHFIYGNVNSADYGVWISGSGTFNKPARRIERFTIPGRNGDLTIDEGKYDNVTVTYEAFISRGFEHRFHDFMAAMMAQTGYQRLQDDYDSEHFRMGIFANELEPTVGTLNRWGKFTLEFDCMPQRFLISGDDWIDLGTGKTLNNPTKYMAIPIVRLTGGPGMFGIHGEDYPPGETFWWDITVTNPTSGSLPEYIDIDSDAEECYYFKNAGQWNQQYEYWNSVVDIELHNNTNYAFPVLYTGRTRFNIGTQSGFSSIKIKPRWWEL